MKKRKKSIGKPVLVNTYCRTHVEYVRTVPSGDDKVYTYRNQYMNTVSYKKEPHVVIEQIAKLLRHKYPYKLCFVRVYIHSRTGRVMQKVRSKPYYIFGRILSKMDAAEHLQNVFQGDAQKTLHMSSESIFCVQDIVEPILKNADYSYLSQ